MPVKVREIIAALCAKGFREVNSGKRQRHRKFALFVDGKRTGITTHFSHGADEYGEPLAGSVSRQMGLKRSELAEFVECTLGHTKYVETLIKSGKIRPGGGEERSDRGGRSSK